MEELVDEDDVRAYIAQGFTHDKISDLLTGQFPSVRGFSARSVRRYCKEHDIHWTTPVTDDELQREVEKGVEAVGPTYGRKTMKGYLATQGLFSNWQARVGRALKEAAPEYHQSRQASAARRANPIPYYAEYFGHKLHIDQNEKLGMYGVTHVAAIDGYSGKLVQTATMPLKNNQVIYRDVFRPVALTYGLWDQLRVDHGSEFLLTLFVQESLSAQRTNTSRECYVQSDSRRNHPIERIWGEVNQRVNYPIKAVLNILVEQDALDLTDEKSKFSVSSVAMETSKVGMARFVDSWNMHPIPGRGTPDFIWTQQNRAAPIPPYAVPSLHEAVLAYEAATGGTLVPPHTFGLDVLAHSPAKTLEREQQMRHNFNLEDIFSRAVNGDGTLLQQAVTYHRRLTESLL
ncbi:uncharacterized protein [Oscarella lobularis]|uniref:uncharacterized protein n=1 Tax=Oscarella lobularis TaxID=121494 RepID=UPI003313C5F6